MQQPKRNGPSERVWRGALLSLLLGSLIPHPAPAQQAEEDREGLATPRRVDELWTLPSGHSRLIWGQWTWHLSENREGVQNDRILAVVYRGYFAGTFRTSHGPRGYAIGVERDWLSHEAGHFGVGAGFRLGFIYGYDGRLGWLAEAMPLLPFAQPLVRARVGPIVMDLTQTWAVVSIATAVRF